MRGFHRTICLSLALALAAPLAAAPALAAPAAKSGGDLGQKDPLAKQITGSPNYLPTFGLRASVARGFEVAGFLSVDAGLDVPDAKNRKKFAAIRPRVVDAMRGAVTSYASTSYIVGEPPNADMLRARLQKAVDAVMGKDVATVTLATVMVVLND